MAQFFEQNLVTVYFFYGLAFFAMGLVLIIESGRSSDFPFAIAMAPLAAFGIIHGFHEWLEMFQLLNISGSTAIPDWLLSDLLRLLMLAISFSLLVVFGVRLIYANHNPGMDSRLPAVAAAAALLFVWLIGVLAAQQIYNINGYELAAAADVLGRYMLAIPGTLLAAWAILLEQKTFRARGMAGFGRALLGAAIALIIYGTVGQIFARSSPIFPSNIINGQLFLSATGVPIQLLRTICAIIMTLFIIRAVRAFDLETEQQLEAARQARRAAQKTLIEDQKNIEQLNQELREAARNLASLYGFSQSLAKTLDKGEMIEDALAQFINGEPHIDASVVLLRDQAQGAPYVAAKTQCPVNEEYHDTMFKQALDVGRFVVDTGQPAIWTGTQPLNISESYDFQSQTNDDPLTISTNGRTLGAPLNIHGARTGSLVMCTVPDKPPFSAREFALISTAAEELSIALQNAALYQKIQEHDNLRGELLHQVVIAQEAERQRIARELHDGTGQTMTALGLGLAAVSGRVSSVDNGKVSSQVDQLKDLCTSAMIELRDVISDLRPALLDDLGLLPALRGQVQAFEERTGIQSELIATGSIRRISPDMETIVFRIVQEALTNIGKHSAATSANVELNFQADNLYLGICDNGRGFDTDAILQATSGEHKAWGLLGMQERLALTGGSFDIASTPGVGTTIELDIPIEKEGEESANGQDKITAG